MASHKITRRELLAGLSGSAVGLILAACGGQVPSPTTAPATAGGAPAVAKATEKPSAPEGGAIALKLMSWDVGGPVLDEFLADFDKKQGTKTEYVHIPSAGYREKQLTLLAGGMAPDVQLIQVFETPEFAFRNQLLDLDPYLKRDRVDTEDFIEKALLSGQWKGKQYAIGDNFVFKILYYNIDLFEKAGVPRPPTSWKNDTWTFDKFLETAIRLTKKESGQKPTQYGFSMGLSFRDAMPWIWGYGGDFADASLSQVLVAENPGVEALQFLQDLYYKHGVAPTPDALASESQDKMAAGGKLAMWRDGPWKFAALRKAEGLRWDIAPSPGGKKGAFSCAEGAVWMVWANGKQLDKSWELLKQLVSREGQLAQIKRFGFPGSRKSITNSQDFLGLHPPEHTNVISEGCEFALTLPQMINFREVEKAVKDAISYLLNNEKNGAQVAQVMKDTITPLLAAARG